MKSDGWFQVVLKDTSGNMITADFDVTLKEAVSWAKYWLTAQWAKQCGTSHGDLNSHKVEILDEEGDCVWDRFI